MYVSFIEYAGLHYEYLLAILLQLFWMMWCSISRRRIRGIRFSVLSGWKLHSQRICCNCEITTQKEKFVKLFPTLFASTYYNKSLFTKQKRAKESIKVLLKCINSRNLTTLSQFVTLFPTLICIHVSELIILYKTETFKGIYKSSLKML